MKSHLNPGRTVIQISRHPGNLLGTDFHGSTTSPHPCAAAREQRARHVAGGAFDECVRRSQQGGEDMKNGVERRSPKIKSERPFRLRATALA